MVHQLGKGARGWVLVATPKVIPKREQWKTGPQQPRRLVTPSLIARGGAETEHFGPNEVGQLMEGALGEEAEGNLVIGDNIQEFGCCCLCLAKLGFEEGHGEGIGGFHQQLQLRVARIHRELS